MDGMTINHIMSIDHGSYNKELHFFGPGGFLVIQLLALERCLQQPPEAARREPICFFWENGPETIWLSPESIYMTLPSGNLT